MDRHLKGFAVVLLGASFLVFPLLRAQEKRDAPPPEKVERVIEPAPDEVPPGRPGVRAVPLRAVREAPARETRVFELGGEGLSEVRRKAASLVEQGLEANDPASVVVPLKYLSPQDARGTLQGIVQSTGPRPSTGLRIGEVLGARKLILSGRAADVDHALRILHALDVPTQEAERIVKVIQVENVDVQGLASSVESFLGSGGPRPGRTPAVTRTAAPPAYSTRVLADSRTGKLFIQTDSEAELQDIEMLVRELDVRSEPRRQKTIVYRVKFLTVDELVSQLNSLFGGHRGSTTFLAQARTNSLLIRAHTEDYEEIVRILELIDVPPGEEKDSASKEE